MDVLRIAATARVLNYLPEYYADDAGYFAQAGLQVYTEPREPWTRVLDDLESGAADIALCGLWVPTMFADMKRDVAIIGQLNARLPMAIVTREPVSDFSLSWLSGRTVLVPGYTGTVPYVFTAGLLREAGINPAEVRFVRDLSRELLLELFAGGVGDAFIADLLTATQLEHDGLGVIACPLAEAGGIMSNSVYCVRPDRLESLREPLVGFMASISAAMSALVAAKPADVEGLLARTFPAVDPGVLASATGRMMVNGTWEGIRIDPAGCLRMSTMMYDAGLALRPMTHGELVVDDIATAAEAAAPAITAR